VRATILPGGLPAAEGLPKVRRTIGNGSAASNTATRTKSEFARLNPIVVIPARMAATRLPGKPLAMIGDAPMIVHVARRAREADIGPVLIACGEAAIADAVRAAGFHAVPTDPALPSGSDRVHAALREADPDGRHDVVINLQGDFPTIAPSVVRAALDPLVDPAIDVGTLVCPVADEAEAALSSVVKAACVFAPGVRVAAALYFSRLPIPWGNGPRYHHIGIYAYRRAALARFVALPEAPLEQREKLEQLRALEAGMRIGCALIDAGPFGVDTPADLERARQMLAGQMHGRKETS
jgi:3-deoxy-manno-octulosonate cytidylyltransferase (CMP-KDO synthetase)